jgi:ABC-type phosphate transport system substrate-binding protein
MTDYAVRKLERSLALAMSLYASDGELTVAAQLYIDFIMSGEGQALAEENGFISVQ